MTTPLVDVGRARLAHERIRAHIRRTPVLSTGAGTFGISGPVTLKLEQLQRSGSFKVRGAFNSVLSADPAPEALLAASGGNHGLAVAFVARELGLTAEIFVPGVAAAVKRDRISSLGATVHVVGEVYADAQRACDEHRLDSGSLFVHPYDQPHTVAGQATVGLELVDQVPDVETVVVAVGGGGLAAGLTAALPHSVRIVAVEPERASCFHAAKQAGAPVEVDVSGVAADSLGARRIGDMAWSVLAHRAESCTVTDDAILDARRALWTETRIVAEPGGATALAALTTGTVVPEAGERVAVVVCGGNTDPSDLV